MNLRCGIKCIDYPMATFFFLLRLGILIFAIWKVIFNLIWMFGRNYSMLGGLTWYKDPSIYVCIMTVIFQVFMFILQSLLLFIIFGNLFVCFSCYSCGGFCRRSYRYDCIRSTEEFFDFWRLYLIGQAAEPSSVREQQSDFEKFQESKMKEQFFNKKKQGFGQLLFDEII